MWLLEVSHAGLSTQSLIHSALTLESLHLPLPTAEPDRPEFFRTIDPESIHQAMEAPPCKVQMESLLVFFSWLPLPHLDVTMCEKMQGRRCEKNRQKLKFDPSEAPRGSSKDALLGPLPGSQWSLGICSSSKLLVMLSFTMDHGIRRAALM